MVVIRKEITLQWKIIIACVVASLFVLESGGGIVEDDGTFCNLEQGDDQCPSGMTEVYRDSDDSKVCCEAGTKAEKNQKAKALRCRPSKCVKNGLNSHEGYDSEDLCTSSRFLTQRVVNDKQLEYDNLMEDRCTSANKNGETQDGVIGLCCPKESVDSYLVMTFGAESNEFPFVAKLTTPGHCGATVYNKRFIISAAHCVVDDFDGYMKPIEGITVTLAPSSINDMDKERFMYKVKRIIPHKQYSKLRDNPEREKGYVRDFNDIALLELDRDIQFGGNVKALEIAPKGFRPEDYANQALVLGWGRNPKRFQWTHLQKSNFLTRNDSSCFDTIEGYYWTMDSKKDQLLCLGGILEGSWSPIVGRGDSGGPLVCRGSEEHPVLCGLASFGPPHQKCLDNQNAKSCPPSVFVDVGYFHEWIKKNAGEQEAWTLHKPYLYGREVAKVIYEHQVHILSDSGKSCGGTLITKDVVLTAAHCVFQGDDFDLKEMNVGLRVVVYNGKQFNVQAAEHLPGFKRLWPRLDIDLAHDVFANMDHHKLASDYYHKNDMALIKLSNKVNIDLDEIIQIPEEDDFFTSAKEVALTRNTTNVINGIRLMERNFKILQPTDCQKRLSRLSMAGMRVKFDDGILCGLEKFSGGSTCDRELGGGLICRKGGKDVICGVQVFRLCERVYPNLFMDVGYHIKWIQSTIAKWSKEV